MCNRARGPDDPRTVHVQFALHWETPRPMDNTFAPATIVPNKRIYAIRHDEQCRRGLDVMTWDVLGGQAAYAMTNVRDIDRRWRKLATVKENRCLIPVQEFAEWTTERFDLRDDKPAIKGEMWFAVPDQPVFAIAGFWQQMGEKNYCAMMTCDANELVAPIHGKAMVTILEPADYDRWLTGSYEDVL